MLFPRSRWLVLLALACLAAVSSPAASLSSYQRVLPAAQQDAEFAVPSNSEVWETRFIHSYNVTVELPTSWRFFAENHSFRTADWERSLLLRLPEPPSGQPLEDLCVAGATRYDDAYTIDYAPDANPIMCIIESDAHEWSHALIRLPQPLPSQSRGEIDTLWWFAHRKVLRPVVESISFDPPTPRLYLEEALNILEENYIFADELDWQKVREFAFANLDDNSTYDDAHDILFDVFTNFLAPLDNAHSAFRTPEQTRAEEEGNLVGRGYQAIALEPTEKRLVTLVYPGSPAERAGLRPGDVLLTVNGQTIADFLREAEDNPDVPVPATLRFEVQRPREPEIFTVELTRETFDATLPVSGRRVADDIAYLETYSVGTLDQDETIAYAEAAHQTIADLNGPTVCGWIVDVRRNTGGSVLEMALSIAPLWGEGVFLRPRDVSGGIVEWSYADGVITNAFTPAAEDTVIEQPYTPPNPDVPVAVLISQQTASMGEVTVRRLQERPDGVTRTFGERTRGWDGTLLTYFGLYDDARMDFADSVLLDANGEEIRAPIDPDAPMAIDYTTFGTDDDPLIQAAVAWLEEQPECSAHD